MHIKKDERNEIKSTSHSRYRCQYHIVFAPKYRRKEIYVDTVGRSKKIIAEYIRNQLEEDYAADQISIKEYADPFTGDKNKKA